MMASSSPASCRGRARGLLVSLALQSHATAPRRAREALRHIPELNAIRDDVTLVVSELVTNAVKYSGATEGDRITLNVVMDGDRIKIQVHDPARTDLMPQLGNLPSQEGGGLGLRLVSQIACRWDTECRDGRTVWAELALGDAAPRRMASVQ
jgi:anti-sigma regulatory factor (Ser/Thr protein kinase)